MKDECCEVDDGEDVLDSELDQAYILSSRHHFEIQILEGSSSEVDHELPANSCLQIVIPDSRRCCFNFAYGPVSPTNAKMPGTKY